MQIDIYRHGTWINSVPDNEALRLWIIDNCPYDTLAGIMPPTFSLKECKKEAEAQGYTFINSKN